MGQHKTNQNAILKAALPASNLAIQPSGIMAGPALKHGILVSDGTNLPDKLPDGVTVVHPNELESRHMDYRITVQILAIDGSIVDPRGNALAKPVVELEIGRLDLTAVMTASHKAHNRPLSPELQRNAEACGLLEKPAILRPDGRVNGSQETPAAG